MSWGGSRAHPSPGQHALECPRVLPGGTPAGMRLTSRGVAGGQGHPRLLPGSPTCALVAFRARHSGGLVFPLQDVWHEECNVRLGSLNFGGEPLQLWLSTRCIGLDYTMSPTSDPSPSGSFDVHLAVENLFCCSLVHSHR